MNGRLAIKLKDHTILIIDDIPANVGVLVEHLEEHHARVVVAQDGEEGLQRAAFVQPDLILLDVMMPGIDGFETCRRLKSNEQIRDIPVIFMTALDDVSDKLAGFKAGGVDYVTKPLQVPEVLARVETHLSLRDVQRELARARDDLERRVEQRTIELKYANAALKVAQAEVMELNQTLERRIEERTKQLERANRELESFSYSVSHDLSAPLRAINGFSGVLLRTEHERLTDDGKRMLSRVVYNAAKMAQLIDEILEYSRAGNSPLERRNTDVESVVHAVVSELQEHYPNTSINIENLPSALADAVMLNQIFENLIGNALKYSSKGECPQVDIGSNQLNEETIYYVKDNGAGFDMRYAARLFGMFQRMHTDSDFPGTGVGLAIVKRLVERHEGRIWVEAELNAGATFYFTLGA